MENKTEISSIRNLVFEGGSVKGIAYVGAYRAMLSLGLKPEQLTRIAGTSAGSIVAMLISIGYTDDEMLNVVKSFNFENLLDQDTVDLKSALLGIKEKEGFTFFSSLVSKASDSTLSQASSILSNAFGLFRGEFFRLWAERIIEEKTGTRYLTFLELHELHEKFPEKYRDLYVVGVNVNTGLSEVFSYETTPNVIVSDAIRISMSIPFIFKPHFAYIKQENIRQIDELKKDVLYVDGGILNNYPLFIFDKHSYLPKEMALKLNDPIKGNYFNLETLGFRLVNTKKIDFLKGKATEPPKSKTESFLPYFQAVLSAIFHKQESDHILSEEQSRTVYIDNCGINMLDFNLSVEQQFKLVESGEKAVREFFEKYALSNLSSINVVQPSSFLNVFQSVNQGFTETQIKETEESWQIKLKNPN